MTVMTSLLRNFRLPM